MTTQFITARDEFDRHPFPDSRHYRTTTVEGDLADRVRATGTHLPTDVVQIVETGAEDPTSANTVNWTWDFEVTVAGVTVFSTSSFGAAYLTDDETEHYNGMDRFFEWLRGNNA